MHYFDEITMIETCGEWDSGKESGFYKVIVVDFLFGGSRFWIQRMGDRDTNGRTRVVETLSIAEVNDDHEELIFSQIECHATKDGIKVLIESDDGYSESEVQIEIHVGEDGKYRFKRTATGFRH